MVFLKAWVIMILIGVAHTAPDLLGVEIPAIGYWLTLFGTSVVETASYQSTFVYRRRS